MDDYEVIRKRKEIHGHQGWQDRSVRGIGLHHIPRHSEGGQLLLTIQRHQVRNAFPKLVRKGIMVLQGSQKRGQKTIFRRDRFALNVQFFC